MQCTSSVVADAPEQCALPCAHSALACTCHATTRGVVAYTPVRVSERADTHAWCVVSSLLLLGVVLLTLCVSWRRRRLSRLCSHDASLTTRGVDSDTSSCCASAIIATLPASNAKATRADSAHEVQQAQQQQQHTPPVDKDKSVFDVLATTPLSRWLTMPLSRRERVSVVRREVALQCFLDAMQRRLDAQDVRLAAMEQTMRQTFTTVQNTIDTLRRFEEHALHEL